MNKIVKMRYLVADLPTDLRQGLDPEKLATVTVFIEDDQPTPMTLDEIFAPRRSAFLTGDEIDKKVRQQRDEWDY